MNRHRLSYKERRTEVRTATRINATTLRSLQSLSGQDNLCRINALIDSTKSETRRQKLLGLRAVLEELLAPVFTKYNTAKHKQSLPSGAILFDRPFELCSSYGNSISKQEFRDEILGAETGLGVLIYSYQSERRFIILNNEKLDVCELLKVIHEEDEWEDVVPQEIDSVLTAQDLSSALESMETEYDRSIAKLLVCTGKSRSEIYDLGLKPDRVVKLLRDVKERIAASENTTIAANDMVELRYKGKQAKLEQQINEEEKTLESIRGKWTDARIGDLEEKTITLKESLERTVSTLERQTKQAQKRFNQAVRRTARRLVPEQRLTRRSLGAGRKRELDSEDEEWLLKCIEDKATIHGRRHESVLYTHQRVKTRDRLNIANYRRYKQGKRLLRSVSSVATRARPTNKRSQQAKRHIGKGLWCSKKPPKTEDHGNECTHHQWKHVKLAKEDFFSATNGDASLCISMDDKAYLRPETSEGAKGARQQTILQPSDETLARALPVHDYPEASVYITPSAFRLIRKKTEVVDDKVTLIADTDHDDSIVVVEPKAYVPTHASTWASNSMRLRWEKPNLHEARNFPP